MNNKNKDYGTTVYVGTVNGKAKRKHIRAGSERELKKKIAEIKADVAAGKDVYTRAVFGVWANKWINEMNNTKRHIKRNNNAVQSRC